jgi:hypothetical protein
MIKTISIIALTLISVTANCQEATQIDTTIDINILNAPSNPAFNLMGISPSSIDKPTDLNAFRLSIQNATNNFSKLPSNYAIELSPALLFGKKSQTLRQFNSTKLNDYFWQTFSVSLGLAQANHDEGDPKDTSTFTKLGFGIKFSLLRPKWTDITAKKIDSFYYFLAVADSINNNRATEMIDNNPEIKSLQIQMASHPEKAIELNDSLRKKRQELINKLIASKDEVYITASNELKKYAKGLKIERSGPFLDVAAGLALDFPDNKFTNSLVSKAGAWITGGYQKGNKGVSILGIGRYLYQPDKIFADDSSKIRMANISTFDAGVRIVVNGLQGKFSMSTEAIYRSVLNKNVIDPSWRLTFNAEYDIGVRNQKITLALGRNFDGTVSKAGTLIAAINFIKGFGSPKNKL